MKKYKNQTIIDSRDPIRFGGKNALDLDFTKMFENVNPDAAEEIDVKFSEPKIDELEITASVDSDHAHDRVTQRCITGLLILIG